MLVDKQNELMSDLLFTVHQHGSDDVTCLCSLCSYDFRYTKKSDDVIFPAFKDLGFKNDRTLY